MVLITIVTGAYKPTYNWGASHGMHFYLSLISIPSFRFTSQYFVLSVLLYQYFIGLFEPLRGSHKIANKLQF